MKQGHSYIDPHTRFFTSSVKDTQSDVMTILTDIDPDHALAKFLGGKQNLFYGPDNEVKYYERVTEGEKT